MKEQRFQQALQLFQAGQLVESQHLLEELINCHPDFAFAYNLSGVIAFQMGQSKRAEELFKQAIGIHQEAFDFYLNLGHLYMTQEKFEEGIPLLEKSLELNSEQLTIRQQLIECYLANQQTAKAYQHVQEFLKRQPDSPEALSIFCRLAIGQGHFKDAYQALLKIPVQSQALPLWDLFSLETLKRSQYEWACQGLEKLLLFKPNHPEILNNLGTVYSYLNQSERALQNFDKSLEVKDDFGEAYLNRAFHLWACDGDAAVIFKDVQAALKYQPTLEKTIFDWTQQLPELSSVYGLILEALIETSADYRIQAASCLAMAYEKRGDIAKACDYYQKVLDIEPDNYWYEIKRATTFSPFLNDWSEIEASRQKIKTQLNQLLKKYHPNHINLKQVSATLFKMTSYTFNLAYHGLNDLEINQLCGQLWHQIFSQIFPPRSLKKKQTTGPIRLAFLSTFFRSHSVMHCFWPLIEELAIHPDFDVSCIALSDVSHEDELTEKIKAIVSDFSYMPLSKKSYHELLDRQFDLIIFSDVGMDPFSYFAAQWRLAPVQIALAGHPVTTGSVNMDYFISSELYEVPEAQEHYSETLVLLKNTDVAYQKPLLPDVYKSRQELGWSEEQHVYFCPMTLFKVHPDFDLLIRDILLQDPEGLCLFAHDAHKYFSPQLLRRFQRRIPEVLDHIQFLEWLPFETYLNMLYRADVVLDSVHFGGGNTNYQTMAVGTPLVTWPSRFFRGRSAQAIYGILGIDDCIVDSHQAYVNQAVKVATDRVYQQQLRARIMQNHHRLYDNHAGNQEMIQLFKQLVES